MPKDLYRNKAKTNGGTGSNGNKHTIVTYGSNGYRRKLGVKKGNSKIDGSNPKPILTR